MSKTTETFAPISKTQRIAFFAMVVGMFMAILDIQIVASSLSVIAAGLGASNDELSWIQTSYLIAEVIVIPMTGFLNRSFSTRYSFSIAAAGFTIMSALCAASWSINSMIIFRFLQGLFGGLMIPSVSGSIFTLFPPSERPKLTILIGLVVTLGPTLGPIIGGYVTEYLSWHFMFLMNVPFGIFVSSTVYLYGDFNKPDLSVLKNFDYLGVLLLALWLGPLQYVLEEGNKNGWFEDSLLLFLIILSSISLASLIYRELVISNPIVNLAVFKNKRFTIGCMFSFIVGIGMFGANYMIPLFLFSVKGFDTVQIGLTMMVTGAVQFMSAPVVGKLFGLGVDFRILLFIGFSMFGLSCYYSSNLTVDSNFWEFFFPQVIRGASMMMCFVPSNNIALGSVERSQVQNASGLFNLMRNLGGAIGLALISSMLINKSKIFSSYISENISSSNNQALSLISQYKQFLTGKVTNPELGAYMLLNKSVSQQGFILAINEIFIIVSLIFAFGIALIPFIGKIDNDPSADNSTH